MEKLRQLCVYSINPHRISPFYFFKSHLPLILITAKKFITLHSCKLFLKTLKYYLVTCWFISLVGSPPGVVPPILAQVYCVTDGFTRPVRVERWGPWKGSVLHCRDYTANWSSWWTGLLTPQVYWVWFFLLKMCFCLALAKLPALDSEMLPQHGSQALTYLC